MKAEQRNELETNALADRMGHLVTRMKTQPRRATLYYVIGALAVVVAVIVGIQVYNSNRRDDSRRGQYLYIGSHEALEAIKQDAPKSNQAKAARFQEAWLFYWEIGVKALKRKGQSAMAALYEAEQKYKALAEECQDDPTWESEAMYALAAIEETRTVVRPESLEAAKKLYDALEKKHPTTARGRLAKEWLTNYDDKTKREELTQFYDEMRRYIDIPPPDVGGKKLGGKDFKAPPK